MKANANESRQREIDSIKAKRLENLKTLADTARQLDGKLVEFDTEIKTLESETSALLADGEKAQIELEEAEAYKVQRVTGIDEALASNKPILPANDPESKGLVQQIVDANAEIGEAPADQLTEIEASHDLVRENIDDVNVKLLYADNAKKIQPRIDELKAQETYLAQKIANSEKELEDIKEYYKAECVLIESAVNDKFKHVKFRLFKNLLKKNDKGETDTVPCCDALLNGVPYSDMSDGEKIFAGIDIVNVLSEHFDVSVPLFIDRAETFTKDCEAKSLVIELHAVKGVTALEVKIQ